MTHEIIKTRRSIRKFKPTPIPKDKIIAILEAAMLAPSACNTRPWRFIAITNREMLNRLADAHKWAQMLRTAPLAIVVVALPATQDGQKFDLPLGFYPQDCGAATQNILLQAEALGLGSCWCGVYPKPVLPAIREILEIPEEEQPFNLIAVGEKDEWPEPRGRYDEAKVTWIE
ncbi:MAG: nitroreductase family protein [Defluviitaleaceae bacterium]|nr:nitroreductase family protein [Defluviitaleaceae bacterium]